jgi:hypothetical protein
MKRTVAIVVVVAVAAAGVWFYFWTTNGSRSEGPDGLEVSRPVVLNNEPTLQHEQVPYAGKPTAKAAIEALLATADDPSRPSAMPKGTRLLSVAVERDVATIDLSKEFRALDTMGDTGESLAQRALRRALAQIPGVERMNVMVEGTLYSGEHSGDWSDIPVRDTGAAPQ